MILDCYRPEQTEDRIGYRTSSKLIIRQFSSGDVGTYQCVSSNSLGSDQEVIRIYGTKMVFMNQNLLTNHQKILKSLNLPGSPSLHHQSSQHSHHGPELRRSLPTLTTGTPTNMWSIIREHQHQVNTCSCLQTVNIMIRSCYCHWESWCRCENILLLCSETMFLWDISISVASFTPPHQDYDILKLY